MSLPIRGSKESQINTINTPAVLAEVIADDAVSLADAGIVTADVTV